MILIALWILAIVLSVYLGNKKGHQAPRLDHGHPAAGSNKAPGLADHGRGNNRRTP